MKSPQSYRFASLRRRLAAKFLDVMVVVLLVTVTNMLAFKLFQTPLAAVCGIVLGLAYWIFADAINGQSIGKRVFKLKVIDFRHGTSCSMGQAFMRNAAGVGWIWLFQQLEQQQAIEAGTYTGTVVIDLSPQKSDEPPASLASNPPREKMDFSGVKDYASKRQATVEKRSDEEDDDDEYFR